MQPRRSVPRITGAVAASLITVAAVAGVTTAGAPAAAIPAAMAYNYFGHMLKEINARMEDFSIEFLNMTDRSFEE